MATSNNAPEFLEVLQSSDHDDNASTTESHQAGDLGSLLAKGDLSQSKQRELTQEVDKLHETTQSKGFYGPILRLTWNAPDGSKLRAIFQGELTFLAIPCLSIVLLAVAGTELTLPLVSLLLVAGLASQLINVLGRKK